MEGKINPIVVIAFICVMISTGIVPLVSAINETKTNLDLATFNVDLLIWDQTPPVTSIYIDSDGVVTLIAVAYPLNKNSGVKATYYQLNGGEVQIYDKPFQLPEGTTTITYWSEDNIGQIEAKKTTTFTLDTTPPTVEIISPEPGMIYLFGSPLMNRVLGATTICIGNIPIKVHACDGDGYGVKQVNFYFDNGDTGFATEPPYEYTFWDMHFGELTVSVNAIDNVQLVSDFVEMTIVVYSIGLL
ncbi:MAG: hypothetical protein R6V50_02600 [Thermoplasmatota archaeon]